jgi:hypothetical protein
MAQMSPLRRRMIQDMTLRNLSRQTQQSYIYAVAKFSRHFNRSPDRLGLEDVRAYQLHLIGEKYSWSHINQVACALRFFYGITLDQKKAFERILTATDPQKPPPVLDHGEVARSGALPTHPRAASAAAPEARRGRPGSRSDTRPPSPPARRKASCSGVRLMFRVGTSARFRCPQINGKVCQHYQTLGCPLALRFGVLVDRASARAAPQLGALLKALGTKR